MRTDFYNRNRFEFSIPISNEKYGDTVPFGSNARSNSTYNGLELKNNQLCIKGRLSSKSRDSIESYELGSKRLS